ncbi:hypothetical protein OROHE_014612 [Orobanche hederae]
MAAVTASQRGGDRGAMELEDDNLVFETSKGKPPTIQQRAVLPIISGRDVIAQAQSGTGKTTMIALAVCQTVDLRSSESKL